MKKTMIILLIISALLTGCSGPAIEASTKSTIRDVTRGDLLIGQTADGKITLPVTALNFEVSGKISNIYASVGSSVKKGDILAELDDSDLQIALSNAEINLAKAEAAYRDALTSAEYNLKSETQNLESLYKKYNTEFDDYSYVQSISSAKTTLSRKEKELADAKKELDDALAASLSDFDSYTYDISIENAKTSLSRKQDDLAAAESELKAAEGNYNSFLAGTYYDYNIKNLRTSLERKQAEFDSAMADALLETVGNTPTSLQRKQAELDEAKRILEDALSGTLEYFDSYSYDNAIASAETNLAAKQKDVSKARDDLFNAMLEDPVATFLGTFDSSQYDKAIESAQKSADDALSAYEKAKADLERAIEKYIEDAQSKVDSLELSVADLQSDSQSRVKTAQLSVDDAQSALNKALDDLKSSLEKSVTDAQSKVKTAQISADDAQLSLARAENDLLRAQLSYVSDKIDKNADDARTRYDSAVTARDDAELALRNANENLARAKENYAKDLESTLNSIALSELKLENMKNSTSSIDNAYYSVEDAKNKVKTARNDLEKIKVTAPISGTILDIGKKVGEVVSASSDGPSVSMGSLSFGGSSFITLCDTSEIYLTANIAESDIMGVEVGQTIRVNVDALQDAELYATVMSVSSIPSVDSSGIITYEVIGKLNELNSDIKDNMSLFLTFIKKERKDVIIVPNKAVFVEDNQQYVYVVKDGDVNNTEKRAVTCGLSNGTQTEVMEGLAEGEQVLIKGVSYT